MSNLLDNKTIYGILWSAIERFSIQGIQFVLGLIIARLIAPSDYGLIAMISIFLAIAQTFIDSGFSNALIQKENRTETDFSTVFYFNVIIAFIVYSILYFIAPYIANFYKEPLLKCICRWIGLSLIFNSFILIHKTKLIISFDFKKLAKISSVSVFISGLIAVWMALNNFGVWALVCQSLVNSIFISLLLLTTVKWHPKLVFSIDSFKQLFNYGSKLLLGALLHTIYINLYTLVIGRFFDSERVGYFTRSQYFSNFASINITDIINRVTFPLLCKHQHDNRILIDSFYNILQLAVFCIFPTMILLCVLSKPLILFLLGDKWLCSAHLLSILSCAYIIYPLLVFNWQLLNVKGRTELSLKSEIIKKILAIFILFISVLWGIEAVCWGLLVYNLIDFVVIIFFVKKVLYLRYIDELKVVFPYLFSSLISGLFTYICLLIFEDIFLQLFIGFILGSFVYLFMGWMLKMKEVLFLKNKLMFYLK